MAISLSFLLDTDYYRLCGKIPHNRVSEKRVQSNSLAEAARAYLEQTDIDPDRYQVRYQQIEDFRYRNRFDAVFSVTAIHWIKEKAYERAYHALKNGGVLYAEQSGAGAYEGMRAVLCRAIEEIVIGYKADPDGDNYFYHPSVDELSAYLEKLGFDQIEITEEIDDGTEYDKLYEDYISTNARPYIEEFTAEQQERIRERFLETCYTENTSRETHLLWVRAVK